jgi:hypothetical protein
MVFYNAPSFVASYNEWERSVFDHLTERVADVLPAPFSVDEPWDSGPDDEPRFVGLGSCSEPLPAHRGGPRASTTHAEASSRPTVSMRVLAAWGMPVPSSIEGHGQSAPDADLRWSLGGGGHLGGRSPP